MTTGEALELAKEMGCGALSLSLEGAVQSLSGLAASISGSTWSLGSRELVSAQLLPTSPPQIDCQWLLSSKCDCTGKTLQMPKNPGGTT